MKDETNGTGRAPERPGPSLPSRREFVALGIGAFVVASLPGALAGRRRTAVRRTVPVMGTLAEIAVVHGDRRYASGAIDAAIAELRRVERTMTRFRPDSDVGRANLAAASGPVVVGAATAEVVAEALRWAEVSDGRFDPSLARAVALWDVARRREPPAAAEARRFAGRGLYRQLELSRRGGESIVAFHDPDLGLDLGGIAKGYGVDRAAEALRAWGIRDALVNVGGDLYALGASEDGDAWEVGIRSPEDPTTLTATLRVSDRAIATSGDYEQFFDYRGRRYHHLLDPSTGEPVRSATRTVTVAADRCLAADSGATAVFGLERAAAARLLARASSAAELVHMG